MFVFTAPQLAQRVTDCGVAVETPLLFWLRYSGVAGACRRTRSLKRNRRLAHSFDVARMFTEHCIPYRGLTHLTPPVALASALGGLSRHSSQTANAMLP